MFSCEYSENFENTFFRRIPLDNYFCLFQSSTGKCLCKSLFLIKLQVSACNLIKKETLALVLPCEFREISKNTFSYRRPPVAASVFIVLGVNKKNNVLSNNSLITCKFLEYSTIHFANDTLKEKLDLIRFRGSRPEVF